MEEKRKKEKGQSFVEFILLLTVLASISYFFLAVVNGGVSKRWRYLVIMITSPTPEKLNRTINYP